jgi:hypothetical protein
MYNTRAAQRDALPLLPGVVQLQDPNSVEASARPVPQQHGIADKNRCDLAPGAAEGAAVYQHNRTFLAVSESTPDRLAQEAPIV